MPQKRTHKGAQIIAIIIAILLLCVAGFCAYLLIDNQQQKAEQKELFATIAEKVDAAENELGDLEQISTVEDKRVAQLLEVYGELHNYNSDFVGWIRVPGTEINYPVMQSPDSPNYYLRRNFEKAYSNLGTPYLQENCDIRTCDNLIIYGHHMLDGGMFSDLELYTAEQIYVRNDMEEAKTVEVLIHEIGHAYMHDKTRFEEAKEHLKVISDRDSREIQAESLSYIVTHKLGLDTSGFSFPYIAAWSSNHTEQEVMNAMIYIRDEADAFYDLIEKKLELELNKSPQLNVEPALQTEETKPISNISDGDEVKMATGNLNYSTDQNTTHTENAELKEELNSELYNSMFEEQEHYRNWLLSLPPEEILFHAFSYSVREDILMTQEENNFSIEKCKALLKSPTPLADMKRAYDKTETNYMDDIRSIMENHANDVIEENKKKSSDRETTVSSVRDVADFAELFANDRISGAEKEKD